MTRESEKKTIDFFETQIESFVEGIRPAEEIRDKLDLGYKYENWTFEIFELSAAWDNKKQKIECSVVKCRYIISKSVWKLYWMRASGKWESYRPNTEVNEVLEIIKKDHYGCFWAENKSIPTINDTPS